MFLKSSYFFESSQIVLIFAIPIKNKEKRSVMKIKRLVLSAIRGNTDLRKKLKGLLKISEPTLYRMLHDNDENLTKAVALKAIREEFGLCDEDILEEEGSVAQ